MDWVFDYFSEGSNETAGEVIETTGAIIMGRHTYEVEDRYRPGIYGGARTGPYFGISCRNRGWCHRPGRGGQSPPSDSIASAITAHGVW
jgi:hypothetical protein